MRTRIDAVAAVALVVLWSSGFIGAEFGTAYAPGHTLLLWRYLAAAAILVAWCWYRRLRPTWIGTARQALLGVFCQFLYLGAVFSGVGAGVPPAMAALIAAIQPLLVAAASSRIFGDRVGLLQKCGLLVGLAGVALAVLGDISSADASWLIYLLPVAGMLALSIGTLGEKILAPTEPIPLAMAIQAGVSAVGFLIWCILAGDVMPPANAGFALAVAWTVALSTFGAYGVYMLVIRRSGPTRASILLYLTPPTTMLWALLMFGDPVTVFGLAGLAVSAIGVWLFARPAPAPRPAPGPRRARNFDLCTEVPRTCERSEHLVELGVGDETVRRRSDHGVQSAAGHVQARGAAMADGDGDAVVGESVAYGDRVGSGDAERDDATGAFPEIVHRDAVDRAQT